MQEQTYNQTPFLPSWFPYSALILISALSASLRFIPFIPSSGWKLIAESL